MVDGRGGCSGRLATSSGVPVVLFSVLSFSCFSLMIFVADDTQLDLSCLPSERDSGIDLIAHDVEVIACYAAVNGLKLLKF